MDHVDLQAFGVDVKFEDFDFNKLESEIIDRNVMQSCSKFGFLNDKLLKVELKLKNIIF